MAWQVSAFLAAKWDNGIGPGFYCPTCHHNPENDIYRDIENNCPRCPLMIGYEATCVTLTNKLIEKQGGYPEGWDISSLISVHAVACRILDENKDRIDGRWAVTFAQLCRIIQQERAQTKAHRTYADYLRLKAIAKK